MENIINEDKKNKYIGNPDGSVRIIAKDKGKALLEKGYWVRVPEKWWRGALSGLRPTERCIMVSLRVWGHRRPKKDQLARELGVDWKTINKAWKKLAKRGLV